MSFLSSSFCACRSSRHHSVHVFPLVMNSVHVVPLVIILNVHVVPLVIILCMSFLSSSFRKSVVRLVSILVLDFYPYLSLIVFSCRLLPDSPFANQSSHSPPISIMMMPSSSPITSALFANSSPSSSPTDFNLLLPQLLNSLKFFLLFVKTGSLLLLLCHRLKSPDCIKRNFYPPSSCDNKTSRDQPLPQLFYGVNIISSLWIYDLCVTT